MTGQPFESAAVIADELLIAMLGAGDAAEDDELGALLGVWRAELAAAFVPEPRVVAPIVRRRVSRGFVTGAVSALLVAGGGVAAAATSGPHGALGELHKLLFGAATPPLHQIGPGGVPLAPAPQSSSPTDHVATRPSIPPSAPVSPRRRDPSTRRPGGLGGGGPDGQPGTSPPGRQNEPPETERPPGDGESRSPGDNDRGTRTGSRSGSGSGSGSGDDSSGTGDQRPPGDGGGSDESDGSGSNSDASSGTGSGGGADDSSGASGGPDGGSGD